MLKALVTGLVVVVSTLTLGAKAPVTLKVNPRISLKPTNVTAFIKLDPHPDNRWLTVAIGSSYYGESSLKELYGEESPEALTHTFKNVRPGIYLMVVTLQRTQDKLFHTETTFCIGGPGVDCTGM